MDSFTMNLSLIQPSQLYICREKLEKVRNNLAQTKWRPNQALPIKKIGDRIFFTDGHTRAFALMEQGFSTVEVYWERDPLDWMSYLICTNWCLEEGIATIADLKDRVVAANDYEKLWYQRCSVMQQRVREGDYAGLSVGEIGDPTEKALICSEILHALPDWFGIEEAKRDYIAGVGGTLFFAVRVGTLPVGFISLVEHNGFSAEIYVCGVFRELHRRGLGKQLLAVAEEQLIGKGKKFLCVKTLGEGFFDQDYARTKMFYRSQGFYPLFESEAFWGSGCPCLMMVKTLQ